MGCKFEPFLATGLDWLGLSAGNRSRACYTFGQVGHYLLEEAGGGVVVVVRDQQKFQ